MYHYFTLNYKIASTAVFAEVRFHPSSSILVALLRKTSASGELTFLRNPRDKPIS